jgi:hypothetical protein
MQAMQGIKEMWQIIRKDSEYIGSEKPVCYGQVIRTISSRKLKLLICAQNITLSRKK